MSLSTDNFSEGEEGAQFSFSEQKPHKKSKVGDALSVCSMSTLQTLKCLHSLASTFQHDGSSLFHRPKTSIRSFISQLPSSMLEKTSNIAALNLFCLQIDIFFSFWLITFFLFMYEDDLVVVVVFVQGEDERKGRPMS